MTSKCGARVMASDRSVMLSFRVSGEKASILDRLAKSTERSKSWLLERALDDYLASQAWQVAAVEEGLADVEAGRVISHEEMRQWLLSWGKDDELEPPL